MEQPEFSKLLALLGEGDTLVVTKLDRFARTASDGAKTVQELVERGVEVNVLNMGRADSSPMENSIALAQKYLSMLDEVYKASAKAAILDATKIDIVGGNTVKVFKTSMDGLGDYSRNEDFVNSDMTGSWKTMTLTKDRGRSFQIDRMANEITLDMAFGTLAGEFIRTKVVPEVDAYTFAKMTGTSGNNAGDAADITVGTSDVPTFIEEAERQMNEDEVPAEDRILFISETAYATLKGEDVKELQAPYLLLP